MQKMMKFRSVFLLLALVFVSSCGEYPRLQKTSDAEYKYEAAKAYFAQGKYGRASELLGSLLATMKGTPYGEECLYLLGMSNLLHKDYESAGSYFQKYYQAYPKGIFVEPARYYTGYSLYKQSPDARLDQASTQEAIHEFQTFLDHYPATQLKPQTQEMIGLLQDRLVEKEYLAAKLYYDLGNYILNSLYSSSVSNYESAVITAQNALKDFPFASASRREEFAILILRSKYELARQSVEEKRVARFRDAIDEYYAFVNDFPESKYMQEAKDILAAAESIVKRKKLDITQED
ncbi:MAG: outer membrane protein assembly factor BamD [Bacteroidaceae bacterium]|nr:outer membrane protein assembly factor BamD [Bacteroidaceae bacterium]MBQ2459136.1 outer membrane protein assembly factor BamD [Bacteroidaceae bacterium]MBQ2519415.1 outer membrane protein assembly factor BamD [Bacteroidaceae bacterium]MBQ2596121.1 outer membrane protein assembly factor BamD [Bacteroidaceae bacterium]MBQ3992284.1 outer membrane protein assembly factor BamD [Bacteroidaceae bacterium]